MTSPTVTSAATPTAGWMATPAAPKPRTSPGFLSTLASEWRKLQTLRSTYVMLGLAVVLAIGISALLCWVVAASWSAIPAAERTGLGPVTLSLSGQMFSDILLIVLAVTMVSSEYATGMIRLTLTATPRRSRVLTAKLAVVGTTVLVVGTLTVFGEFFIGQAILSAYGLPTVELDDPGVSRALLLAALTGPALPLFAACLAVLFRSAAGTISGVLALLFVPGLFGALLPDWWQENVLRYFPGVAGESLLTLEPVPGSLTYLEPGAAVAVLAGWVVVAAVAAYAVFTWRDA